MLAGALATALLLGSCCLTVFGQADTPADLKSQIKQDIGFLKSNVFSFWQQHGLDSEFGGFHGTLDRTGSPVSSTEKGLVQQARHTWYVRISPCMLIHSSATSAAPIQGLRVSTGTTRIQVWFAFGPNATAATKHACVHAAGLHLQANVWCFSWTLLHPGT